MAKIKLTPLGGLYEFGNQSYLYRLDNTAVLIDAGAFFDDNQPELLNTRFLPDYNVLDNIGKLDAILITHNHEDHFGGLTYLLQKFPKTPVYCSPFVADNIFMRAKVEGMDVSNLHNQIRKVSQYETIAIQDNFNVEFLPTEHSVPEASMIYITTPQGNILHTGDWRYGRENSNILLNRLYKIQKDKLLALVADSTGVNNTHDNLYSESQIYDGLKEIISKNRECKKFIVSTFSTHVERVSSICKLAQEYTHKDPLFLGTGMCVNQNVAVHRQMLPIKSIKMAQDIDANNHFYIVTGSQAEPGSFLLKLSMEKKSANEPTCIIMSASEIPERKDKIRQMISSLTDLGYKVIRNDSENLTHMSGHATRSDMEKLIEVTRPEVYIPIHGEECHLKDAQELAYQLNVPEVALLKRLGETISIGNSSATSIYHDFKYRKISVPKTFNPNFVHSLLQKTR